MPGDEIIETMARAYDREQAAQMGEPDPWKYPNPAAEAESKASMRAALSAAEAAGWVMVQKENVQAMIDRLQFCLDTFGPVQDHDSEAADLGDWCAMIEARP